MLDTIVTLLFGADLGDGVVVYGAWVQWVGAAAGLIGALKGNKSKGTNRSTSKETVRRGNVSVQPTLEGLLKESGRFNLEEIRMQNVDQARYDTAAVTDEIFRNYREQALPEILAGQTTAGVYGSSTTQSMVNDAYARTVGQSAELALSIAESRTGQQVERQATLEDLIAQLYEIDLNQFAESESEGTGQGSQRGESGEGLLQAASIINDIFKDGGSGDTSGQGRV